MMSVKDRIENPIARNYRIRLDTHVSPSAPHPTGPMPEPRYVHEAGTNIAEGEASHGATINTREITSPMNGSGWQEHAGQRARGNTQPTPEPRWTGGGTHPALRR